MSNATYQTNCLDQSYNGWTNHETWNVALWIQNDEGLYNIAREAGDYEAFAEFMTDLFNRPCTPDGILYNDPSVNVVQLNSEVFDF